MMVFPGPLLLLAAGSTLAGSGGAGGVDGDSVGMLGVLWNKGGATVGVLEI